MTIAALRAALADDLGDALGIPVHPAVPERLNPPLAYLREADPFIQPEPDAPFGTWQARFAVDIVERVSPAVSVMIAAADAHLEAALTLADTYDLEAGAYTTGAHAGQSYLIVPLTITAHLT